MGEHHAETGVDDDDQPPPDWTKSKADWEWEQAIRRRGERVALKIQNPATSKLSTSEHKQPEVSVNSTFRGRASLAIPPMKSTVDLGLFAAGKCTAGGGHATPRGVAAGALSRHVGSTKARGQAGAGDCGSEGEMRAQGEGSEYEAAICLAVATPRAEGEGVLETQLMCPQCSGDYTDAGGEFAPKLLPCFHSVCASCARDLAKYKGPGRRCPMCREDVGYEELVDNFVVLDMLDEHQLTSGRERACSNECIGDDANATHYCELCSKFLCQLCVSMHSRQRATVGHTLVTMQELQSDAGRGVLGRRSSLRLDTTEFCVKHPDHKLDLFCVSCNMIVCSKCALLEHPPPMHTLEGVDEIMAATASEIQTLASKCDLVERRLDASRSTVHDWRQQLHTDADEACLDIERCQSEIVEFVRGRGQEAMEAVLQEKESRDSEWEGKEDELSDMISALKQVKHFALATLHTPRKMQVIKIKSNLLARLQKCQNMGDFAVPALPSLHRIHSHDSELAHTVKRLRAGVLLKECVDGLVQGSSNVEGGGDLTLRGREQSLKQERKDAEILLQQEAQGVRREGEELRSELRQSRQKQEKAEMELEASQQQLQQARRSASEKDTEQQREREKHSGECQLLRNSLIEAKAVLEQQLAASREEARKAIAFANELASRAEDLEQQLACSRKEAQKLDEASTSLSNHAQQDLEEARQALKVALKERVFQEERYEETLKALKELEAAHESQKLSRAGLEERWSALRRDADEQTDMIASLESDLRLALKARDALSASLEMKESVSELERIVGLEAECSKLRNSLQAERSSLRKVVDEKVVLELKLKQVSAVTEVANGGRGGGIDPAAEEQLHRIAEDLEAAADEWRSKYCDLRLKAEILMTKVNTLAQQLYLEASACSSLSVEACTLFSAEAEAIRLWLERINAGANTLGGEPGGAFQQGELLTQIDKLRGELESQQRKADTPVTPVMLNLPGNSTRQAPSHVPGGRSPAVGAQCPVSPPALSPEVTARLRAEMSSARVQRAAASGESPVAEKDMDGSISDGLGRIQEGRIEASSKGGWGGASLQEEPVHKENPGQRICREDELPGEEARSSSTKEHLLELELKAIKMEYEGAKDRWQREREAILSEMSDLQAAAQHGTVLVSEEIQKLMAGASDGTEQGRGSRPGSMDGSGNELKELKNEYLNAQMRWDKEREDLQNQFRSVLQACMEAEIAAEQGRKREAALHAALQAEKRESFSHRLSGQSLQESPVASSFANDSSISGHVAEPGRSTPDLSSPPPGGGARSGLDGLEDSAVDWHLLSPALHAQRQANIAGRKHGGSFSRKIVEEIVEKMEKKSAAEQAKVGKLKELLPEGEDTKNKEIDWV